MSKKLRAGVAITEISPEKEVELAGYPHCPRNNTGVHDPLYASCIYLDNGITRLALVAMDLLFYSKKYVKEIQQRISKKTGIPQGNIILSCSHTHSGPWAAGRLDLEALEKGLKPDQEYVKALNNKIEALVLDACSNTFDARVGIDKGHCGGEQGVGGNRRDPKGPADNEVCVLGVQDSAGQWRGCLVCYALHPTLIHSESTVVTADYPAYIRKYLSWAKPGMITLFTQGTSGDQSTRYFRDGQNFEEANRIGTTLGIEAGSVLDGMEMSCEIDLLVDSLEVELKLRKYPERKTAEDNVKKAEEKLESLRTQNASYIDIRNAELKLLGAEDILGYIILEEKGIKPDLLIDEVPMEITVVGIGAARIVGLQGEAFVEIGLEIKKRSPFEKTFVIELTNGAAPGYAYTRDALEVGGYETDTSMLAPEHADMLIEAALRLLKK